ncbi:MAG: type I methionyl aminopeptidase [Saprospiraceae bacterium]|nr:type I methionyl aminopeptidase [Saprospiraceae bacterium]
MSIQTSTDLHKIKQVSEVVGKTLRLMREYAQPGMSTKELDEYGYSILQQYGAKPAPNLAYGFPGWTCISINHEAAHGIPSAKRYLQEGDLVNIDVSAELDGYYADNGGSFILGKDKQNLQPLVEASQRILQQAIQQIKSGVRIAHLGRFIQTEAKKSGFKVIKNLVGHGVGKSLHEEPHEIPNFYDRANRTRFRRNTVVAVETFISTRASQVYEQNNGWTYATQDGSFVAQHEHTIIVTDGKPIVLTAANGI